jgi:hypothetical protein
MIPQVYTTVKRDWDEEDMLRQLTNLRYPHMTTPDEREYRYEERHDEYMLKCWHHGVETSWRGYLDARPEWLERILVTATVGGHLKRVPHPPPDSIVWFTTDLDNNLLTFLELT